MVSVDTEDVSESSSIPMALPLPSGKIWGRDDLTDTSSNWDAPSVVSREFGATSQVGNLPGPGQSSSISMKVP